MARLGAMKTVLDPKVGTILPVPVYEMVFREGVRNGRRAAVVLNERMDVYSVSRVSCAFICDTRLELLFMLTCWNRQWRISTQCILLGTLST